ncbi:MAG: glucose-6-phosphate isomerase 1 [Lysobacteraceae bacterium]|nr:MAG: glucose-6-phosphate isomerase 1 [Xanthomonadaceae bacterium]
MSDVDAQGRSVDLTATSLLQKSNTPLPKLSVLFESDPDRVTRDIIGDESLLVDLSRLHLDRQGWSTLLQLADVKNVLAAAKAMFHGAPVNVSEQRPALHTALRGPHAGVDLDSAIEQTVQSDLARMLQFAEALREGRHLGTTGKRITDLVSIGIGGSHLGPAMLCQALPARGPVRVHFMANIDAHQSEKLLASLLPEQTMFCVTSKSFGTQETLANARRARQWLQQQLGHSIDLAKHMIAISSNADRVAQFGLDSAAMLPMHDWVGGRYSVWSAVGLPVAAVAGSEQFKALLTGARSMDEHFLNADPWQNIPLRMALASHWYRRVVGAHSWGVVPYDDRLSLLPQYLQQLIMESNGKRVTVDGEQVSHSAPVIWGGTGTNAQHAFFQCLHQGTDTVPIELIGVAQADHEHDGHHQLLLSNLLGQAAALMQGRDGDADRHIPGNRPAITLLLRKLDAHGLGQLLALYEHRTFVEGVLLGINSFDQFGVELGKQLADRILPALQGEAAPLGPATQRLVDWLRSTS